MVGKSKNKNIDVLIIEVKKLVPKKATASFYADSTMSSALNFCFLSILLQPLKKDHIRRKINIKKKKIFICEISVIILI